MVLNKIGSDQSNSRSSWGNRGGYSGANNNGGRCCLFLSTTFLQICDFEMVFFPVYQDPRSSYRRGYHGGEEHSRAGRGSHSSNRYHSFIHSAMILDFAFFRKVTMPRRLGALCWIWLTPNVTFTLGFHTTFTTATSLSLASQASFQSPPQGMPV